jgi:ABC-2 type transport system permease protein
LTTATLAPPTVVAPRRSIRAHVAGVWQFRELLANLVRKELKVKYKNSALGFVWSLLNPAMYLVVFYVVFQLVLDAGIPSFAIYLLSGLLAWNLFAQSLSAATTSIVGNATLVGKVWFPREILPLAAVGANLVHFLLQACVLMAALVISRHGVELRYVWLALPAVLVLVLLASAFAIFLASVNVYARDTQHLLELALLAWFWMTPIVYQWALPATKLEDRGVSTSLLLLNPMVSITLALQRALYGVVSFPTGEPILPDASPLWYFRNLAIVGVAALVFLALAIKLFDRLEGNFAEAL